MKLYTEEEVRKAISEARFLNQQIMPNERIIDRLYSIELPSNDDLFKQAIKEMEEWYGSDCKEEIDAYFRGAIFVKELLTKTK